jgi:diguanylate cyclase (GGDEF)-like protein
MVRSATAVANILLVEDRNSDAELVRTYLEDCGTGFHITRAHDLSSAMPLLAEQNLQAVMLDLFLPDAVELDGLASIQTMNPNVPILILTGREDEELAFKAVERGAQDYLLKEKLNPGMLRRSIGYAIQRKRFEGAIIYQANFDKLTGLANRDLFRDRLTAAFARHQRQKQKLGLMLLDLNGFKAINDTFGHDVGDVLLQEIGRRMPQCLRPYDLAARLGGDEFVILIEDVRQQENYAAVAAKLIECIEAPVAVNGRELRVGVSIGIAVSEGEDQCSPEELMRYADEAMYMAKKNRTSNWCFHSRSTFTERDIAAE